MAEKYSFFNSVDHDRQYKAEDWADYFASFIGNGIFPKPSIGLQVTPGTGMTVNVAKGSAFINGYRYENSADGLEVTLSTAPSAGSRIDRIVVRWDRSLRKIYAVAVAGTAAASPAAPALTRTADKWELCLATVAVSAGATSLTQSSITDTRTDTTVCGLVVGTVDEIDFSTVFAQYNAAFDEAIAESTGEYDSWKAEQLSDWNTWSTNRRAAFDTWFADIQTTLSGDVAGALQAQIDNRALLNHVHGNLNNDGTMTVAAKGAATGTGMQPVFAGTDDKLGVLTVAQAQKALAISPVKTATATLTVAGWSGNAQTVNVTGVTATNAVIVRPAPGSHTAWLDAGVYCTAQGAGTLAFACEDTPTAELTANVLIVEVSA